MDQNAITIQTVVYVPIGKVWEYWTSPEHISGWAFASDDWEAIGKTNDVRVGGAFNTRMQARDMSGGFDFTGVYTAVNQPTHLAYDLDDGRHVQVDFTQTPDGVAIVQSFDPESENPREFQQAGWQAFLDNFKNYSEKQV